jgi:hypothetical protein
MQKNSEMKSDLGEVLKCQLVSVKHRVVSTNLQTSMLLGRQFSIQWL